MKMTKKKVFVTALAVCLVAILSMGSLAWFSAQDSVTNNFHIADSADNNPDDIFSVDVYEKYDSDEDGNPEEYQKGIADSFVKTADGQYIFSYQTGAEGGAYHKILTADKLVVTVQ